MNSNVATAEAYYTAIREKRKNSIEQYLHPNVHFKGPMAEIAGRAAVLQAVQNFSDVLLDLTISAKFESETQAMLAYDVTFPEPMNVVRGAVLMNFREGLISRIELFYDASKMAAKKDEIFSNSNR